jgi:glycosyltransferase involved in cell wall biosynthesis
MRPHTFTFAVIGRNEAATLPRILAEAQRAAEPGDRVWFIDGESSDASAAVASRLGVEVLQAPVGKGRAISRALERAEHGYVCLLDGDLRASSSNIGAELRAKAVATRADMVVASFGYGRAQTVTPRLYWPLVEALLPEVDRAVGRNPISGHRVIDVALVDGPLPPGYGAETFLNLSFAAAGRRIETVDVGPIENPYRSFTHQTGVGREVASTILDFAVAQGRLDSSRRPRWDAWVEETLASLRDPNATPSPLPPALAGSPTR